MSETTEPVPMGPPAESTEGTVPGGPRPHRENVSTRQMRTIGQRRHDAEEKLARHLEQARHHQEAAEQTPEQTPTQE
ncbi:hypothetical protein SAMN04487915_10425 [Arthrobacter sp. ov118]|jgi:hypothetical protein|nr:hypothetical protein SAMN04487915_10425 [Arthrobacter sp. ov118]